MHSDVSHNTLTQIINKGVAVRAKNKKKTARNKVNIKPFPRIALSGQPHCPFLKDLIPQADFFGYFARQTG